MGRIEKEYCKCGKLSVYSEIDDWGYWLKCTECNGYIEDSYTYFNHADGEDEEEIF